MCFASNPESYRYIPGFSNCRPVASGRLREAVSEATAKKSGPEATEDQKATETKKPVHWGTGLKLIRREGKKVEFSAAWRRRPLVEFRRRASGIRPPPASPALQAQEQTL